MECWVGLKMREKVRGGRVTEKPFKKCSVLVVEDETRLREMLLKAIPDMGFPVKGTRTAEDALRIILNQVRVPDWNRADLNGLVAACRTAARRVQEMCARFGVETYLSALSRNVSTQCVLGRKPRLPSRDRVQIAPTSFKFRKSLSSGAMKV